MIEMKYFNCLISIGVTNISRSDVAAELNHPEDVVRLIFLADDKTKKPMEPSKRLL
jgi:hypothetical protein